jgi:glycosyltransferase involved in cell wall biosynthesis
MQVVIVSDFGDVNGGAAQVAITSARGLAEVGIPVIFVCAVGPISPRLNQPGIAVHCLDFESVWARGNGMAAAIQGIWNLRACRALDDILGSLGGGETIVHFHQWTKALSPSVLAAPLRRGLPSIASLHDYFIACPNGAYYRFPQGQPCQFEPMSASCITASCDSRSYAHKMVRVARQYATGRALARAGTSLSLLSVSPFADQVIERFAPESHARFVVRSPVEIVQGPAVQVSSNSDFVFVGRLTEEKGVLPLARMANDMGISLTVIGEGPLLGELQRISGTVHCTGWLDATALARRLERSRALVFPSTWYETGGLVVLEALARGIPVIVSRTTAAADFVSEGINGYIIEAGDTTSLSARMLDLLDDDVAARLGSAAYNRYWTDPQTVDQHTRNLLAVYQHVLSEHRRGLKPGA